MKRGVAPLNCNESRGFLFSALLAFLLIPFVGLSQSYYYWCLKFRDNPSNIYAVRAVPSNFSPGWAWVQSNFPGLTGTNPYQIGQDSGVYLIPGVLGTDTFELSDSDAGNLNNYFSALSPNTDPNKYNTDWNLFDYNNPPTTGLPHLKPDGSVITDGSGSPVGVVGYNAQGDKSVIPVSSSGNGYYTGVGYDESGNLGTYEVSPSIDGVYPYATFTPNSPSSGGDSNSSTNPVPNNISPPQTNANGNVSTPTETVTVPDGSGGTTTITMRDYTPLLSQIAINQIEGINRIDSSLNTIKDALKTDDSTIPDVAPPDDTQFVLDTTEVDSMASELSGWGFSFGMESNPIGNLFTAIFGNPPTSFGSVDRVWSVEFDLGFTQVTSTFQLSDWFISAFRSCILMIETIVFGVAIVKAISGAFA